MIRALTAYGVTIPRAFADRKHALAWAEEQGDYWPGCRLVQTFPGGRTRTIWRHQAEREAA